MTPGLKSIKGGLYGLNLSPSDVETKKDFKLPDTEML